MARMHTRKGGKSKSKKPIVASAPGWVEHSKEEIVDMIVKLAKEGHTTTEIGSTLKNKYGVPNVKLICGKRVAEIIEEKGIKIKYPDDLLALIKKAVNLRIHLKKNSKDVHNNTSLTRVESKIKRLVGYYKKANKLPEGWFYSPDDAALLVK